MCLWCLPLVFFPLITDCLLSAFHLFFFFLSWACKYKILIRNGDRSGAWSTAVHPSQGKEEEELKTRRGNETLPFHLFLVARLSIPSSSSPSISSLLTRAPDLSSRCHITVYRKAIRQHIGWMRSALILASAFVSGVWCESFSFLSATLRLWRS